jgi:hypothetical protein
MHHATAVLTVDKAWLLGMCRAGVPATVGVLGQPLTNLNLLLDIVTDCDVGPPPQQPTRLLYIVGGLSQALCPVEM